MQDLQFEKLNHFSANQRIPTFEGFANCLKSKSIANQFYKLYFSSNQMKYARLGIIASKKCMHTAVERNLNKRVIREVFRTHSVKAKSLDLVVLVRHNAAKSTRIQRVELVKLFYRLEAQCA